MATKAQHADPYRPLPGFLRGLRESVGLTQRELGERLGRAQSWVYNCETGNRRVDVTEFAEWATVCGADPVVALADFLASHAATSKTKGKSSSPRAGRRR